MSRVTTILEGGRSIVFQDFRNLQTPEEAAAAFDESRAVIHRQPKGSVLVLTDFTGSRFTPVMVDAAKQLAADNRDFVKASALVGLSSIQTVLFTGVNRAADRHIMWFDDVPAAKRWLLEQGAAEPAR